MFEKTPDLSQRTSQNENELHRIRKSFDMQSESRIINSIHLDTSQRSSLSSHNTTESALSDVALIQNTTELHTML